MDRSFWDVGDQAGRTWFRHRNLMSRANLVMVDDSQVAQLHQVNLHEGTGEIRNKVQRLGMFGHGSVPLPGASAVISWQGGHRGFGSVVGIEDGRYRARNYKGGETHVSMVDGAKADGTGGKLRMLSEGLLKWIHNIFGAAINIGTKADTRTITMIGVDISIGADGTKTLTLAADAIKFVGPVEITKDLTVDGKITDKGDLSIGGTESGGGPA